MIKAKPLLSLLFLALFCTDSFSQPSKTTLYFFTGQGADEYLFSKMVFTEKFEMRMINYLYKLIPNKLLKKGAFIAQPIVEPDRNKEKEIFIPMLKAKSPAYFKRTISMIVNWDKQECKNTILHIHGTEDHTIPFKNTMRTYEIKGGSHMMVLTRSTEVNALLIKLLQNN